MVCLRHKATQAASEDIDVREQLELESTVTEAKGWLGQGRLTYSRDTLPSIQAEMCNCNINQ
ncbi:hypothetical protein BD414DRAFT_495568 [Trametes punicea]|nr:hypothetical protein BD414DRAFT_495568 [Trametes punicea]